MKQKEKDKEKTEKENKEKAKETKTDESTLKSSIRKKFGLRESAQVLME
jgi:hypothetical protein